MSPGGLSHWGNLDSRSSGLWRSLTSWFSASSLPCTSPPPLSANARIPGFPFNQDSAPTTRERKQHGGCTEFTVKLELLPTGALAHSASPQGRGQPGERCALRSSGRLQSRHRALGSVPLVEERRWYLLRKAFIRCDLVKVTIFTLLNYNKRAIKCTLFLAQVQIAFL